MTLHLGARAKTFEKTRDGGALTVATKDGKELKLESDKILVTVGRKPNTAGWGLENMAVDMDGRFVRVDMFAIAWSVLLTALVAAAAGWLAIFRVLGQKPLEVLRGE